ncbi:MAG: 50S ribosomal protein L3 [bacterium]|nr:50S ribosomal protein L3 [Deltaproteobacteria bacterium]MCP4908613.1 50S ribosomal protein L3 [bacterium]
MSIELICKKLGMSQVFTESGEAVPVTVLEAGPNVVVQKKTLEKDGYIAVQLAFGDRREALFSRAEKTHFEKNGGGAPKRHLSECRLTEEEAATLEPGMEIAASVFGVGQRVDAIGMSKGRGFTGVVRRHGFTIKKRTHGTHENYRHGGSIGAGADPGKVIKGMKMAGQHGNARITTQNLEVIRVDAERNLLFVRGAVPGHKNGIVKIRTAAKHGDQGLGTPPGKGGEAADASESAEATE